jgi:hypothetical protein
MAGSLKSSTLSKPVKSCLVQNIKLRRKRYVPSSCMLWKMVGRNRKLYKRCNFDVYINSSKNTCKETIVMYS